MGRYSLTARQWLYLLMSACILPTIIVTSFLVYDAYLRELNLFKHTTIDTTRALVQVVDRELYSAEGMLQALATSPSLASHDIPAFYEQAKAVQYAGSGSNIVLSDTNAQQVINTLLPFGTPLPKHGSPDQVMKVLATKKPSISDLFFGPVAHKPLVSVDVPVMKNDRPIYVLSIGYFPSRLVQILRRQNIPKEWIGVILDSKGVIVARTWDQDRFVGHKAIPDLTKRITEVSEDTITSTTLEGLPALISFSRSTVSNWTVAIGVPRAVFAEELRKSIEQLIAGAMLSILIGLIIAKFISDSIVRSIDTLVKPVENLGYGKPVVIPSLPLYEANAVAQAMTKTSELLRERTVERDVAIRAERERHLIQRQLEHSEAFQRRVFDEAPNAILLVNSKGTIVRANEEAVKMFGYPLRKLIGLNVDILVPMDLRQRHEEYREAFFFKPTRRPMGGGKPLKGRRADGSEFFVDIMLSPLPQENGDVAIAIVQDITERSLNEEKVKASLQEKEILLREIYHRVKNNLQIITSLFNLQERSVASDTARTALKEASDRVRAMALVHEKLYQSKDLSLISLDSYIGDLCKQISGAYTANQNDIAFDIRASNVLADLDIAVPLGLLLNELISNSLKHAFPDGRAGKISVHFEKLNGNQMQLIVSDNGIGLPPGFDWHHSSSLGLKLVDALVTRIDGQFFLESKDGVVAKVIFSMPKADIFALS